MPLLTIDTEKCTRCCLCVGDCPMRILDLTDEGPVLRAQNEELCIGQSPTHRQQRVHFSVSIVSSGMGKTPVQLGKLQGTVGPGFTFKFRFPGGTGGGFCATLAHPLQRL